MLAWLAFVGLLSAQALSNGRGEVRVGQDSARIRNLVSMMTSRLGEHDGPYPSEELVGICGNDIDRSAIATLRQLAKSQPETFRAMLADPAVTTKACLLHYLGSVGRPEDRPLILRFARSENPRFRSAAMSAIDAAPWPAARKVVLGASGDPSSHVRLHAVTALSNWHDADVMTALLRALDDSQEMVRYSALDGLLAYNSPKISRALLRLLRKNDGRRDLALVGLQAHPTVEAAPDLIAFYRSGSADAWIALPALARIDDPRAHGMVLEAVADHRESIRRLAVSLLPRLGTPEADSALTKALADPSDDVVRAAIEGTVKRKLRSAVPALYEVMSRRRFDRSLVEDAIRTCLGLKDKEPIPDAPPATTRFPGRPPE